MATLPLSAAASAPADAASALAETLQQRLDGLLPLRLSYEEAATDTDEDLSEYAPATGERTTNASTALVWCYYSRSRLHAVPELLRG